MKSIAHSHGGVAVRRSSQPLASRGIAIVLAAAVATLGTAIARADPSHCKGLDQGGCTAAAAKACKWVAERAPAMGVSKRKAHCRLDAKTAAAIARKQ